MRMLVFKLGVSLLSLCLSVVLYAQTKPAAPNPHLVEAKALYQKLQFAHVVHKLEMALAVPGNSRAQLCEIYALLGTVHVAMENNQAARKAFQELLTINPEYAFPSESSPKILGIFETVKQTFVPPVRVSFSGQPRIVTRPGKPPRVEVQVDDPASKLAGIDLFVRTEQAPEYRRRPMALIGNNRYGADLLTARDAPLPDNSRVEYYLQARGAGGVTLARFGTGEQPHTFAFVPGTSRPRGDQRSDPVVASTPWYETWWFWTAVGAVAIGAGVGITLYATGDKDVPVGTLGKLKLD